MTGTHKNPKNPDPQQTKIQLLTLIEKFLKREPVAIVLFIVLSLFFIIEKYNDLSQLRESSCRKNPSSPWCPPPHPDLPVWIGTKIEDVYIKNLKNYEIDTTLVVTDKAPGDDEKKDISVLRNVDQELSKIKYPKKSNSGEYEGILRKAKNNRKPLCLKIYGNRKFETSEFKNIIFIEDFPDSKTYDSLTSEERDQRCKQRPRLISPRSGNSN
jgi:hypothetical protein